MRPLNTGATLRPPAPGGEPGSGGPASVDRSGRTAVVAVVDGGLRGPQVRDRCGRGGDRRQVAAAPAAAGTAGATLPGALGELVDVELGEEDAHLWVHVFMVRS